MKWADLGEVTKVMITCGVTLIGSFGAALVFMFTNFTPKEDFQTVKAELPTYLTVAQDQQQWQNHQQAVTCNRVSELRLQVERIRWELQQPNIPPHVRETKLNELAYLEREIARLDPRGVC